MQSILSCLGFQRRRQGLPPWHTGSIHQASNRDDSNYTSYRDTDTRFPNEKNLPITAERYNQLKAEITHDANDLLQILLHTKQPLSASQSDIPSLDGLDTDEATIQNLKEYFASLVLSGLETAIRDGVVVGEAMHNAIERAVLEAVDFAREYPVYFTLIAIGVLVILAPWILELLGFAELGPIEGSFAALWQARYAGYVPKGSLFSYLQRLGMVWHH